MGCYDSIVFKCPNCGERIEAQSKGGACDFKEYQAEQVPVLVASDAEIYNRCKGCGKAFQVIPPPQLYVSMTIEECEKTFGERLSERWKQQSR